MASTPTVYAFGGFRLDLERRELHHNGALLPLRPKVFDTLALLLEQRHRVVSRDELLEQIWPNRYISDTTLSACLKELRKNLGDDGKAQRIIKTVPRKGFRFVATLEPTDCQAEPDSNTDALPSQPQNKTAVQTGRSERKNLSVLRCGLLNASALEAALGPEAMHYLLQDFFEQVQTLVQRFNGQVMHWLGDGFLALFGVPIAREDHARCALLAADALIERGRDLHREHPLALSFGLDSGEAIVSQPIDNSQPGHSATSRVMRTATNLQTQAAAGRILISSESYRLLRADVRARAFDCKGEAWLIEQINVAQAGVPRRFRRPLAPLIGREQELSLLSQRLAQALDSNGQAVAIVGNPGIGKSRLLGEFRHSLDAPKLRYLQANCFPHFRGTPYYPLAQLLRYYCAIQDDDPTDLIRTKLEACLHASGLHQTEALPLLLRLADQSYHDQSLDQLSAHVQRDKTALYLRQLFLHDNQAQVIALEDLHWMDASSWAWLDSFARQLANQPVLLIVTYRPGLKPDWLQLAWISQLALARLNQSQSLDLLKALPGTTPPLERLAELATLSGGVPFFLEELALTPLTTNQAIPATVQGVLAGRIDQLQSIDKALLQAAAIIGQRGALALLTAVSDLDEDEFEQALLRLQCAELLFTDFSDSEPCFAFRHALVQDVAYSNQLSEQRSSTHLRIAATLREAFATVAEQQPEYLAYHYSEAGRHEDAVHYWQRASRKAYERSAYVETLNYVNKGLDLLDHFDDPIARASSELALYRTLGPTLMTTQGYGATEVEQTWLRARHLCETLQDHASLFRVLIGLSNYYWVCGDFSKAFECNRQLLRLARRSGKPSLMLRAKAAMGELMLHSARLNSAKRYLDHCMQLIADGLPGKLAIHNSAVAATCYAAWLYWHLGQESQALDYAEQALCQARSMERPFTLAIALCLCSDLHRFRDAPEQALTLAQEGVALAQKQGFPFWHGSTLVTLGWCEARTGQFEQGLATIQQGLKIFRATGATVQLTSWLGALADAYRCAGQPERAQATINEALAWAEKTGDRYYLPQLMQLQQQLPSSNLPTIADTALGTDTVEGRIDGTKALADSFDMRGNGIGFNV